LNNLSWFLYFADVIHNVRGLLITTAITAGFASALAGIAHFANRDLDDDLAKTFLNLFKKTLLALSIAAPLAAVIPNRDTIYLIAGSEAGEFVVKNPEAQEILGDIKEVIRAQLSNLKETKTQ